VGIRTLRNKSETPEQVTESPPPSKAVQWGCDLVRRPTLLQTAVFRRGLFESADRLGTFKNLAPKRLGVLHRR
jgi:hypothetical protein